MLADLCPCFHQSPTRPNFDRSRVKVCPILCRLRTKLCPNFGRSRAKLCPISFAPCPFPNLAGTLINTKSYDDLTGLLDRHYYSGENEVISSYHFDTRCQAANETVSDYIVALKKLSINCGFGDETQLNKRLRNRLVVGLSEDSIRNRLLAETDMSWKRACEIGVQMDVARIGSKLLHPQSVNAVKQYKFARQKHASESGQKHASESGQKCYRCLGNHQAAECQFKNAKCYGCNKIGHISKACRNKGSAQSSYRGRYKPKRTGRTNLVEDDERPTKPEALYELSTIENVNLVGREELKDRCRWHTYFIHCRHCIIRLNHQ